MTSEQHNKNLGRAHLAYGGLTFLLMLLMLGFLVSIFRMDPSGPPLAFVVFISLFVGAMYSIMIIPSFIAGYGLLKRRRWAKTAAIIGGVTAAMSFPLGTAVCVYTFWFLFSEPGKALYENQRQMLTAQRDEPWRVQETKTTEKQFVPPSSPPDWR